MADHPATLPVQNGCTRGNHRCIEPQHRATRVPYEVARAAYDQWYGPRYGRSQSFERLHERGGFGWGELVESGVEGVMPHRYREPTDPEEGA